MDYKHSVGDLEYLDPATQRWLDRSPYAAGQSPAEVRRRRLGEAAEALSRSSTSVYLVLNSLLRIPGLNDQIPQCSDEPLLLICPSTEHPLGLLTVWEQEQESYALFSGKPVSVTLDHDDDGEATEPTQIDLFVLQRRLGDFESAEAVAFWARHYLPLLAPLARE
jgi:hypothetical protein